MPDGSSIDSSKKEVPPVPSGMSSISHPMMGSARVEPVVRNSGETAAPPVNIKLTVPFVGRRFYFSVVGGRERRSRERVALERRRNPFFTKSNMTFVLVGAVFLYLVVLGSFLAFAGV
jgi:hypothetical protein